jgi:SOS-response transcriptional repressor LexA
MSLKNQLPTPKERELLVLIHRFISQNGDAPYSSQLQEDFGYGTKYITTLIERLEEKGFLNRREKRAYLTEKATTYLSTENIPARRYSIIPTQVNVLGTVTAGRTFDEFNDVNVKIDYSSQDVLMVPLTKPDREIYALKVVGQSMEHEKIFEGDYILVEEFMPFDGPKENEIIVTKYFPLPSKEELEDKNVNIPESDYSDLTLKVYKEAIDPISARKYYRLGWKKDNASNPYVIEAGAIKPIARVIGVYRNLRSDYTLK